MDGQEKASWRYKWIIKAQMAAAISGELGNAVVGPLYGYLGAVVSKTPAD